MTTAEKAAKRTRALIENFRKKGCSLKKACEDQNWRRIAIYGGSCIGIMLYEEFTAEDIRIECIIDRNSGLRIPCPVETLHPDKLGKESGFDVILVSAHASRSEVMSFLEGLAIPAAIIDVDDLMNLFLETGVPHAAEKGGAELMEHMAGAIQTRLDSLLEKANDAEEKFKILEKQVQRIFYNQFQLMNPDNKAKEFYAPGNNLESFPLYKTREGMWCFRLPDGSSRKTNRILINSIPKCGTNFVHKIFMLLGYLSVGIGALHDSFIDNRQEKSHSLSLLSDPGGVAAAIDKRIFLPFHIVAQFILPGQCVSPHIPQAETLRQAQWGGPIMNVVRDLRFAIISNARFGHILYSSPQSLSSGAIAEWILDSPHFLWYSSCINAAIELLPETLLVRFEDLMQSVPAGKSVQNIAEAAECSPQDVVDAINKSRGTETFTWTGKLTRLGEWWTDEIEKAFQARGFDAMNEQLGYPRRYSPETYPNGVPVMAEL